MINQILFLLCFIITSCTDNDKNTFRTDKQYTSSTDTLQLINAIKKEYAEINSKTAAYDKVEKDVFGQSAEGGIIIAYYDNKDLKKVITTFYGETGKAVTEYYFNKDGLFFAFNIKYFYDKPMYIEGSKIASTEENRYYFLKNQLLKWLDKNKKSVNPNSKEYQDEAKYLLEDVVGVKKTLGDYKPLENKILPGDTVRCKYGIKCPDTGYIIKGSRDVNGRVIHVTPKNKNVPVEK